MNFFDYLFSENKESTKNFILSESKGFSLNTLYSNSMLLAYYLRNRFGENNQMILLSNNSIFFITSYLAIIKSGNVCVPINPGIEPINYKYIEELTESKLVFISNKLRSDIDINTEKIDESTLNEIITNCQEVILKEDVLKQTSFDDNRLAEIIFTSGSTGKPKGVMLTHLNLRANTESILAYLKLKSDDTILLVLPLYYCYGLSVFHTHLKVGASIVFNNNFMLLGSVIDDLKKYRCTGFSGVPSHYQMLLRKSQTFAKTDFPFLRYVTQAGGNLHEAFIIEFINAFPTVDFFVMYGQTEATARLAYLSPELLKIKIGSIGNAIPNVILKVVDHENSVLDINEIGEIVASGANIMKGYYRDIKGTNEVLKNGWLHTGDLGYIDNDGCIFITSRRKNIIKVRGNRISPKEIEEVLVLDPEVIDCTIYAVENDVYGEAIKALIVINEYTNRIELEKKLMKLCREKLAVYKLPQIFEFSIKFDVTSSGKKINSNCSL